MTAAGSLPRSATAASASYSAVEVLRELVELVDVLAELVELEPARGLDQAVERARPRVLGQRRPPGGELVLERVLVVPGQPGRVGSRTPRPRRERRVGLEPARDVERERERVSGLAALDQHLRLGEAQRRLAPRRVAA